MADAGHLYAADYHWWAHHIADIARDFEGRCWSCDRNWQTPAEAWGVEQLHILTAAPGLSVTPGTIHGGRNSGYQAINLALLLGATEVVLLGFDMMAHSGKSHFFGDHPEKFRANTNYQRFLADYDRMKPEQHGLTVLNASRVTSLECFPRVDIDTL